jgi:hypothetical protein
VQTTDETNCRAEKSSLHKQRTNHSTGVLKCFLPKPKASASFLNFLIGAQTSETLLAVVRSNKQRNTKTQREALHGAAHAGQALEQRKK